MTEVAAGEGWLPLLVLVDRWRRFDWRHFAATQAALVVVLFLLVTCLSVWLGGGRQLMVGAAAGLLLHWLVAAARIALGKQ